MPKSSNKTTAKNRYYRTDASTRRGTKRDEIQFKR